MDLHAYAENWMCELCMFSQIWSHIKMFIKASVGVKDNIVSGTYN